MISLGSRRSPVARSIRVGIDQVEGHEGTPRHPRRPPLQSLNTRFPQNRCESSSVSLSQSSSSSSWSPLSRLPRNKTIDGVESPYILRQRLLLPCLSLLPASFVCHHQAALACHPRLLLYIALSNAGAMCISSPSPTLYLRNQKQQLGALCGGSVEAVRGQRGLLSHILVVR